MATIAPPRTHRNVRLPNSGRVPIICRGSHRELTQYPPHRAQPSSRRPPHEHVLATPSLAHRLARNRPRRNCGGVDRPHHRPDNADGPLANCSGRGDHGERVAKHDRRSPHPLGVAGHAEQPDLRELHLSGVGSGISRQPAERCTTIGTRCNPPGLREVRGWQCRHSALRPN
jgi:hypothetical protein